MGRQVNFFATPADTAVLETRLRALEPLEILHSRSPGPEPRKVAALFVEDGGRRWLHYRLVRVQDLADVVMAPVPQQSYWTIDELRSPIVELNCCYFDEKILRRGRVFCEDGYYDDRSVWVKKPESFRKWATRVMGAVRRMMTRYNGEYVGPDARAWLERGGGELRHL